MDASISNKINNNCIEKTKHLYPNLTKFIDVNINIDKFSELYDNDRIFYEITFYDRKYCNKATNLISESLDDVLELKKEIEIYNKAFAEHQKLLCSVFLDKNTTKDYFYFNRIGQDVGISDFNYFTRDKIDEEFEDIKAQQESAYRESYNEEQPFGGAFSSWNDYYNYRGIQTDD